MRLLFVAELICLRLRLEKWTEGNGDERAWSERRRGRAQLSYAFVLFAAAGVCS